MEAIVRTKNQVDCLSHIFLWVSMFLLYIDPLSGRVPPISLQWTQQRHSHPIFLGNSIPTC